MMTLAGRIGIDVPPLRLVDLKEIAGLPQGIGRLSGKALAVARFDRPPGGGRVHSEDFAQVFGVYPDDKYKRASYRNIAAVIAAECGLAAVAEFIRRLTFCMLIGNADMHLKNWSLIYPDKRRAALAPAYDLLSTLTYIPDDTAALNVSRSKAFVDFTTDELSHLAAKARLPRKLVLDTALETVALFMEAWQAEKTHLSLTAKSIAAIDAQLRRLPLVP